MSRKIMAKDKMDAVAKSSNFKPSRQTPRPDWSAGLRKLYDSVVEEPLPNSFKDLLSKLDDKPK